MPQVDLTGVQLALAERQSELPHTARATVSGIISDPELPQDPASAHAGAAQRRTIEELLVGSLDDVRLFILFFRLGLILQE